MKGQVKACPKLCYFREDKTYTDHAATLTLITEVIHETGFIIHMCIFKILLTETTATIKRKLQSYLRLKQFNLNQIAYYVSGILIMENNVTIP